jgi:hypothetical protein
MRFENSSWPAEITARFVEPLELSPGRFACQFETLITPLKQIEILSPQWPQLTFLLDYEIEAQHIKGLAKAAAGRSEHWQVRY